MCNGLITIHKGPFTGNLRPLETIRGSTDKGPLYVHALQFLQTRGPYRQEVLTYKGPLQTRGPYRRFTIPTDKWPILPNLQTKKGPLQTRGSYSDKGPLQTLCDLYR